jgi:type IV secretory pathway VirB2 component (pilin)
VPASHEAAPARRAYDGLRRASTGPLGGAFAVDVAVIAGGSVAALMLGALSLRRRTP